MDMRVNPKVPGTPEPTIGELIRSLLLDVGQLVRTEIKLAQAEVGQKARQATAPLGLMAAGAMLMFGGFLALLGAFVGWLAPLVGAGWAALIVAIAAGGLGLALLAAGRKRMARVDLAPTRSVMSLKQDAQALKGRNR